jgi:hypothetical protein
MCKLEKFKLQEIKLEINGLIFENLNCFKIYKNFKRKRGLQ